MGNIFSRHSRHNRLESSDLPVPNYSPETREHHDFESTSTFSRPSSPFGSNSGVSALIREEEQEQEQEREPPHPEPTTTTTTNGLAPVAREPKNNNSPASLPIRPPNAKTASDLVNDFLSTKYWKHHYKTTRDNGPFYPCPKRIWTARDGSTLWVQDAQIYDENAARLPGGGHPGYIYRGPRSFQGGAEPLQFCGGGDDGDDGDDNGSFQRFFIIQVRCRMLWRRRRRYHHHHHHHEEGNGGSTSDGYSKQPDFRVRVPENSKYLQHNNFVFWVNFPDDDEAADSREESNLPSGSEPETDAWDILVV